ncbi:2-dehydropantoate 2-reductase (Ketopantoate reductase) (KPA reductase) (KPR) [Entomortierella lignicola]|nr:2-dehydropantoate 2-reductase (Ketopantoate reductase) (KPA reductase) (KPR) [Entomortierella lignicola]
MPKPVIGYLAPRFHILGPGGIGSLFAYYFHKHNIPFTFFQRKAPPPTPLLHINNSDDADNYSYNKINNDNTMEASNVTSSLKNYRPYPPTTLKYMNLTSLDSVSVEPQSIDAIDWEPLYPIIDKELFRYDPIYNEFSRSPIYHLLVTTKTYQTVEAISKIRHRLRPWSTIVLMQNGMGVREEICEAMGWTNELDTPNFVQGIISHGAQKSEDTVVHTGKGTVWLAPVIESLSMKDSSLEGDVNEDTAPSSSLDHGSSLPSISSLFVKPASITASPKFISPHINVLTKPYPHRNPASYVKRFTDSPFSSFFDPLSPKELKDLRTRSLYDTLCAFRKMEDTMNLQVIMPEHLLALQFSKLVVNSCVNPVATLLESTNGNLLDSETGDAHQAVKDLITESQLILSQSREYQSLGKDLQREYLTLDALTKTTVKILRATSQNRCSTLQDYLKGSQQCEIDYMNGYLIKMAERDRAPGTSIESAAPFNRMVTEKVKEKFASPREL